MNSPARFCGHCGAPLQPGTRFCGRCGTPVQPAGEAPASPSGVPASEAATPPSTGEPVPFSEAPTVYGMPPVQFPASQPPEPQAPVRQPPISQPAVQQKPVPQAPAPQAPYAPPPQGYAPAQPPTYGPPATGGQPPAYPPPVGQQAGYPPVPPQAYAPPPAYYAPPPVPQAGYAPRPKRRGSGGRIACLGCLGILLVLAVAIGGLALWRYLVPPLSKQITLGRAQKVLVETVASSGGIVRVSKEGSPIDGLSIQVPAGAYDDDTRFTISFRPIEEHRFGDTFQPITPLIQVENGHGFAARPMLVEIPINVAPGQFAMAFFYDPQSGKLEGIPTVGLSNSKITVLTAHFSSILVSAPEITKLQGLTPADTGFTPGEDDWQFTNWGSIVAPNGHCAGQSISAMWYYLERRLVAKGPQLHGHLDNNDYGVQTPGLWQDDSWGYRLASTVQTTIDFDALTAEATRYLGSMSDSLTWYTLAYAMAETREPQYISIGRYYTDTNGVRQRAGHALVAYKMEDNKIYVADPNYPGQQDRFIEYDGGFLPYSSGQNAAAIAAGGVEAYPEIRYIAKSSLVNWDSVGALYEQALKGEVGKGVFPGYTFKVATGKDDEGNTIWAEFPKVLEMDEAQTATVGEEYRGKMSFDLRMNGGGNDFRVHVYRGTTQLGILSPGGGAVEGWVSLELGVNDLGLLIENKDAEGKYQYNDFWRVKVLYGLPDLAGTWEGTFQIQEVGRARDYVEEALVRFLLWTGLAKDEAQAREAAQASITEDPNLRLPRPIGIIFELKAADKPGQYTMRVFTIDDSTGSQVEYSGEATYEEGQVEFSFRTADQSVMEFSGEIRTADRLTGTFGMNAWGVVKDAGSGVWELNRQKP